MSPVSTVDADVEIATEPVTAMGLELTPARPARVGDLTVRRLLPLRQRRSCAQLCTIARRRAAPRAVAHVVELRCPHGCGDRGGSGWLAGG